MKNYSRSGFTLVELVIVIVLIAILSAVALPRFTNLSNQARQATAAALAGSLSEAVSISHAQWQASGANVGASVVLDGGQIIYLNSLGWPEDITSPVNNTINASKCLNLWNSLLHNPPAAALLANCTGSCQFAVSSSNPNTCSYTDLQGKGSNIITYNATTGLVVVTP
jgi:MSHA pilin protein MshB